MGKNRRSRVKNGLGNRYKQDPFQGTLPVGRRSSHSGVSIMSTSLLVAKERQPGFPFGLGQKQAKNQKNTAQMRHSCTLFDALSIFKQAKIKKYGANAPQLHAIRISIDFYVMLCNVTAFHPA